MIQKIKNLFMALVAVSLITVPILVPAVASADVTNEIQNNLCGGSNLNTSGTPTTSDCTTGASSSIDNLLTNIINIFSLIVGIVAVIMIIIGGLKYITSGGDSGNVSSAKNTIIFAIVGLVIVALAQVIVHFVLSKATTGTAGS